MLNGYILHFESQALIEKCLHIVYSGYTHLLTSSYKDNQPDNDDNNNDDDDDDKMKCS